MSDQARPPLTTTTSMLPAAAILGLGAVTLVIFILINFMAGTSTKPTKGATPVVVGGLATASGHLLAACQQPDNPPSDIASALRVPVTTTVTTPASIANAGAGDFTCSAGLSTTASSGKVLGYYRGQLEALGWALFSSAPSHGHAELLFQKAGADGFYWVVGVTVDHASATTSRWTYTVYQNSSSI